MKPISVTLQRQSGASLIEVLVAILLLSFGMLSLGALMAFATQAPKLSGYRATATNLAASYVERIRANPTGFSAGSYDKSSNYDGSLTKLTATQNKLCAYPDCTPDKMADMDFEEMRVAIREELPGGGLLMSPDDYSTPKALMSGHLWVMWREPETFATLNATNSDNCPDAVTGLSPAPRCLYIRFKL